MKILPVIHFIDETTTLKNVEIAFAENSYGIFLISMEGNDRPLIPLAKKIKKIYPNKVIGINLLSLPALEALNLSLEAGLDATWTDGSGVTSQAVSLQAKQIETVLKQTQHEFYGSVAFKYQKVDPNPPVAAQKALALGMIPTTSGEATGVAADLGKISNIRQLIGTQPLALASGLTPENIHQYKSLITHGLVSTGISEDFYNFSQTKLKQLMLNLK